LELLIVACVWAGGTRATLFGGAFRFAKYEIWRRKKIGNGKRGRAKIPSPQPPSFLPARAFSLAREARRQFRSK